MAQIQQFKRPLFIHCIASWSNHCKKNIFFFFLNQVDAIFYRKITYYNITMNVESSWFSTHNFASEFFKFNQFLSRIKPLLQTIYNSIQPEFKIKMVNKIQINRKWTQKFKAMIDFKLYYKKFKTLDLLQSK